ncbi:MAG: AAA family ATPase [Nitrospinae bacterium]|nr:AAA family ATPase [Nitrospinota bacterium]
MGVSGKLLYQVVRYNPKSFSQRRPDGKGGWIWNLEGITPTLYHLSEVLKAETVYICEGEKDVDNLRSLGLTATCNSGGAGKWRKEYAESLKDKDVAIFPHNDTPGQQHGQDVARSLCGIAKSVKVVTLPGLPEKGDVSDWIEARKGEGKDLETIKAELLSLVDSTAEYKPLAEKPTEVPQKEPKVRAVSVREFLLMQFPPRENILSPWLPTQGLCMVHAPRGVGKTFFSLNAAVAVASGGQFLRFQAPKPCGVLLCDGEMPGGPTGTPCKDHLRRG